MKSNLKWLGSYLCVCGLLWAGTVQVLITLGGDVTGAQNATVVGKINGTTVPVNAAANQVLVTTAPAVSAWETMPACTDTGGNHLNYNNSTQAFSCGTSGGTATSVPFSGLTGSTNTVAAMLIGSGASLGVTGTGTNAATSVTGFSPAAGKVLTLSNSMTQTATDGSTVAFGTGGTVLYSGGTVNGATIGTATNCSSAADPAVCASAAAGSVAVAATATSLVVNTTRVTANSQIFLMYDSSLGTKLGVTCNATEPALYGVTARTAATSFTIGATASVTNPACFSYFIVN